MENNEMVNTKIMNDLVQIGTDTMEPICNDHLHNKIYFLWFIQ